MTPEDQKAQAGSRRTLPKGKPGSKGKPARKGKTGGPLRARGTSRELVFEFVRQRLLQGEPPTVREVQRAVGFSAVQTAREHLERLVDDGRLIKQEGKSRGYRLPDEPRMPQLRLVPLLGRVQAGGPTLAVEDPEGYVPVGERKGSDELFALRVQGESMIGVGILPGDIVVVRRQPQADSGDIVVALVEDEATVKTLRLQRGKAYLQPENPDFETIAPPDFTLLGKVIEVQRSLEGPVL